MTDFSVNTSNLSSDAKLCVERVLRTTATSIDITKGEEFIREQVTSELEKVIGRGGLVDALKDKEAAAAALTVAFTGFAKLVDVVEQGVQTVKVKRDNLREQMKQNLPVFIVPDKEELSSEQEFIRDLIQLIRNTKIDGFEEGLGIRVATPQKRGDPTCYHVLPFYLLETDVLGEDSHTEELDSKRREIYAHIRTTFEHLRKKILRRFRQGNWFTHFVWSAWEGDNHLNGFNQEFFTLIVVSNLLWKLLHPMNSQTGRRLEPGEVIDLCKKLDVFLGHILTTNYRPKLRQNRKTDWADFIHISQILVQDLQAAYAIEELREFQIRPLAMHARDTARGTAKVLFELLYQHQDEFSDKHTEEPKTAEHLEASLKNLLNLLKENPSFLEPFQRRVGLLPDDPGLHYILNPSPESLIDVLIIYTHLPRFERLRLREELKRLDEGDGGFLRQLEQFDDAYVRSLNKVLKTNPKAGFEGYAGREERAHLIGRRLVPCLTLLMDAFKISVDTEESQRSALCQREALDDEAPENTPRRIQKTGKDQVNLINTLNRKYLRKEKRIRQGAYQNDLENPVPYFWANASELIDERKAFANSINYLQSNIQKMADIAAFVEGIKVIILEYRSVLQSQAFLDRLKACIDAIGGAQADFKKLIERARKKHAKNGSMSNEIKCKLSEITDSLETSLKDFTMAAIAVRRVISDPEFAETQQISFRKKIQFIDEKYADAFDEPGGFANIFIKNKQKRASGSYARMNPLLGVSPDSPRKSLSRELLAEGELKQQTGQLSVTPPMASLEIGPDDTESNDSRNKRKLFRYKHYYRKAKEMLHLMRSKSYRNLFYSSNRDTYYESPPTIPRFLVDVDSSGTSEADLDAKLREQEQIILHKESREKELQRFSLLGLIDICHDSMSYWSQWGHKGTLLRHLRKQVEQDKVLSPSSLRNYILDVARISLSYRRTWFGFFQAQYADSKSGKRFRLALRSEMVNLVLPIAEVLFGNRELELSEMSDADMMKNLIRRRAHSDWEFAEDEILESKLRYCNA